jgi:solute carrier family 25 (adenine nucleotide translocator) protein 4/5/6/31
MMMTVGGASSGVPQYKSTIDAFRQVIATEGAGSLMRGAGANILRYVKPAPKY